MKRRNNRFLAGTLAGLMMLTMLPVTALAAENDTADGTTTAVDGAPVPGTSDNGIENVVNDTGDSQDTGANADANDTGDANPTAGNDGDKTGTSVGGNDVHPALLAMKAKATRKPAAAPLRRAKPAASRAAQAVPIPAARLPRLRQKRLPRKSAM